MTGRESLLAEIEARRHKAAREPIKVLRADIDIVPGDSGYNPYDNPGPAKPLDVDGETTIRRSALKAKKRGR